MRYPVHVANGQVREAERLLELDPAWRHAEVVGKLPLGHLGLGRPALVVVLGIVLHGLRDEIRSPLRSQAMLQDEAGEHGTRGIATHVPWTIRISGFVSRTRLAM